MIRVLDVRWIVAVALVVGGCQQKSSVRPGGPVADLKVSRMKVYQTPAAAERVDTLPLSNPETMRVVQSVKLDTLRAGDVLIVHGDIEATNDCGYNVALGTYIILAPTDTSIARSTDAVLSPAAGFNISANMHHGLASRSGALVITRDIPDAHINLVAYSQSSVLTCGGLKVERGYGQLVVLHYLR